MLKEKTSVEKTVRDIRRHTRKYYSAKEKILLYWRVCVEKIALLSCVDEEVLITMFITAGQRTLWKRVKRLSGDVVPDSDI